MATQDSLTNIANRRAFDSFMETAVEAWQKESRPLSLALFDIDRFKRFNDRYGHRVGDQVLITVAQHLRAAARRFGKENEVLVSRYGGEEFALAVSGPGAATLLAVAEETRKDIRKEFFTIRNSDGSVRESGLNITISVGFAQVCPLWNGAYLENLIEAADKALYQAKIGGRDMAVVWRYDQEAGCILEKYGEH